MILWFFMSACKHERKTHSAGRRGRQAMKESSWNSFLHVCGSFLRDLAWWSEQLNNNSDSRPRWARRFVFSAAFSVSFARSCDSKNTGIRILEKQIESEKNQTRGGGYVCWRTKSETIFCAIVQQRPSCPPRPANFFLRNSLLCFPFCTLTSP